MTNKGRTNDKSMQLFSWNAVAKCRPHRCPARDECPHEKIGRCTIQTKYLRSVEKVIFKNYLGVLSEDQFFRVGMHLIPLYKILSRLKIEELGVKKIISRDKNKKMVVHPIYKEIRETIKMIEFTWKSLGLKPTPLEERKNNKKPKTVSGVMT